MEKLKKIFQNQNRKTENLIVFLVILVITLIIINNIIKDDKSQEEKKYTDAELATVSSESVVSNDLEKRLENILSKIDGVGNVSVLLTYSESSSIVPLYNENTSKSITEETDTSRRQKNN